MSAELVYVRDTSNQRIHKRFRETGTSVLASFEGDNADASGAFSVLTAAEVENVSVEDLCRRCFAESDLVGSDSPGDEVPVE